MKKIAIITIFLCAFFFLNAQTTHTIQRGETLYSLARKYGVSVSDITAANGITDATKVNAGQSIRIPTKSSFVPNSSVSSVTATDEYKIQRGDTYYSLSRKYGISVNELLEMNDLEANSVLKIGQVLKVPTKSVITTNITSTSSSLPSVPLTTTIADPRTYEKRSVDSSTIWPVKTNEVAYSTGKTFSVVLVGKENERVSVIKSGLVIYSGPYRGFGQVVFVHSQQTGHIYVYSGLNTLEVEKGSKVNFGDTLGTLGVDSLANKAQLNLMVYHNGKPVDPATVPRG